MSEGFDIVERALRRAGERGAADADAVWIVGDEVEARVRGDEIDYVKQARGRALGLRVFVASGDDDGLRTAITSTSDLSPDAVDGLVDQTLELAKATAPDPTAGLADAETAADVPDLDLFEPTDRPVDVEERIRAARLAETTARDFDVRIVNSEGTSVGSDFSEIVYGNSRGFLGSYLSAYHSLFSEPLAREGESMQRDYWMTVGRRLADLDAPEAVGREAARRAVERLGSHQIPTTEASVIFDERTAPSLVRQLAGCVSGYSVYRGTTFLADKIGQTVASDLVTIIDDGRVPGGLGSKPFDGEGLATRRNVVVEGGRLQMYLCDSYSGRKLGLAPTGNASRGVGGPPGVGTTNLWMEPGRASRDEIIAMTERGLLVTELIGMGFNPVTGDYSRGAAGFWIEGGEIRGPVDEVTIAGNLGEMLASIDAVASELHWLGRAAAPVLRVGRMTIAGA